MAEKIKRLQLTFHIHSCNKVSYQLILQDLWGLLSFCVIGFGVYVRKDEDQEVNAVVHLFRQRKNSQEDSLLIKS